MINNRTFLKKALSHIPFLNKFIRKIYFSFRNVTYFIPFDPEKNINDIDKNKIYRLNFNNFNKFKEKNEFFLIFKEKSIQKYPLEKLSKLRDLVLSDNADLSYDGDDPFYTEIASKKVLEKYLKKFLLR